ncbi:hypothetical protein D910_12271 [Dendroctonus ponderosae]|uniref:DUF4817 domain-containing protein n=1 Tax=Dendroctonus ponderosae TaxID=77166 RepID=U4ULP7_DENPD|nr:hypothetical protein D910_12271 [Dendroctonus ponderosae]
MKNYPREERIDMIFTLREYHKNCLLAFRVYAQKFPERNHPKPTVFKRLLHQFQESGSVNYKKIITGKSVTEDEENIFTGGILGQYLIGPYFFEGLLNGLMFLQFLINHLSVLLEEVPFNIRTNIWLQLDGAPPHYHCEVRQFLNANFQNRWIGRNGFQDWPPRSPNLTPLHFFLWGYIKGIV